MGLILHFLILISNFYQSDFNLIFMIKIILPVYLVYYICIHSIYSKRFIKLNKI